MAHIELTITNIVSDRTVNKHFGFATDNDGTEYFLPRSTILQNELTVEDIGLPVLGRIRANPSPIEGKANLDHVMPDLRWPDEGDEVA